MYFQDGSSMMFYHGWSEISRCPAFLSIKGVLQRSHQPEAGTWSVDWVSPHWKSVV